MEFRREDNMSRHIKTVHGDFQDKEMIDEDYASDEGNYCESKFEPQHEICNNVVCMTSKASNQHARTRSLIRAFASLLNIL